ncbi:hypothetical protein BU15DRAFT_48887, partial [Melanogaster broomeanus]
STSNTRIERLWVELGTQFVRCWQAFFTRLERMHMLDPYNPTHLWLLHTLFLDEINHDCQEFQAQWNCHPISGPDTNWKSPKDLRLLGQTRFGVYQEGAEHEDRDAIIDEEEVIAHSIHQQQQQIHEAVGIPSLQNPFSTDESEHLFFIMLKDLISHDVTPDNFGLTPAEWESDNYLVYETIHIGHRSSKELHVALSEGIWYSWACLWCQALVTLSFFIPDSD